MEPKVQQSKTQKKVKAAVAHRLRSFMTDSAASFSVLTEQPMIRHFNLRDPLDEGTPRTADLLVQFHATLQQRSPIACDFVSCFARLASSTADFNAPLQEKSRFKRKVYCKYRIPDSGFFPLPFGRTNVLSQEIFDFCGLISSWFPPLACVEHKLLATFSRAIYSGVAQSFNIAVRRLQLSVSSQVPVPLISVAALVVEPEAPHCRPPPVLRRPRSAAPQSSLFSSASADSLFYDKLAAILAAPSPGDGDGREGTGCRSSEEAECQGV